ncbi:MAG: helix-turn-helix transcriptional regulator [Lachnospiraceae bacterium]|nr:helix-turn-helix transcriptional regulator [Lachnospiraceae bacterium]
MALSECNVIINQQGRELAEHGTALFPIACYHDNLEREEVHWHWHDELEAMVVIKGQTIVAAGTEKYIIREGEGIFINAGVLHGAWDYEQSGCQFHSLVFHPRLVGGSAESIFWQKYIQPILDNSSLKGIHFQCSKDWQKEIIDNIEKAWQFCVHEPSGYEFQVRDALSKMIFLLSDHMNIAQSRPSPKQLRDGERMKKMIQYIEQNCGEELSTADIAGSAMISESECLRCFRKTIGKPPIQYVKQFRIHKAAGLLISTQEKIADIGTQCGFQDMSYFTKTFREMKGCTPTEYREKMGNKSFPTI